MRSRDWRAVAVLTVLAAMQGTGAVAQVYGVTPQRGPIQPQPAQGPLGGRPVYSPYLNLLRGGDPAINYYGLIRPQVQFQQSDAQLRQELFGLEQRIPLPAATARTPINGRITGHAAGFMTNQRGGPAGPSQEARQRAALRQSVSTRAGALAPTGHSAWFGNAGTFYIPR